jgi:hypothetical protein
MRYRSAFVVPVLAMGIVSAALPALAQTMKEPEPLTWLLNVTVRPGQFMTLKDMAEKYDKPVLDKLVTDGAIQAWGLACQMIGPPTESCMYYVTANDWAALGKVDKAFNDNRMAMKESERKAVEEAVLATTEPDKEVSSVIRHVVFHVGPGGEAHYLMRHIYKVKPGKGHEVVKLYKEYIAPTYQKLLDQGVILGYGLAVPEVDSGGGWTHASWIVFSDMSQLDAVDHAFEEASKARGEELNGMLGATFTELSVPDAHVDSLAHIILHGGKTNK